MGQKACHFIDFLIQLIDRIGRRLAIAIQWKYQVASLVMLPRLVLISSIFIATLANANNQRFARLILFVPEGTEIPEAYSERLTQIALRTEAFFKDGIERWGWEVERSEIFARNDNGEIEIILARGELPPEAVGRNALPDITRLALEAANTEVPKELAEQSIWWTFYHCPKQEVRGFRGMGGRDYGRAINRYPDVPGEIPPIIHLADETMWQLNLKGCIHEFGHALGLPHIGPKSKDAMGNSLMGPINRAYHSKAKIEGNEPRVYLTEASAAMLANHPIFSSQSSTKLQTPNRIRIQDLSIEEIQNGQRISIKGSIGGSLLPRSVIVLDSSGRGFGDYWARPYVGEVDSQGRFKTIVDETFEEASKGSLSLFFCFPNGRNASSGPKESMQGGVTNIPYKGKQGARQFELPHSLQ